MGLLSLIYLECSGFEEPKAKDPAYMQWPGPLQGTHSTEKTKRKKKSNPFSILQINLCLEQNKS